MFNTQEISRVFGDACTISMYNESNPHSLYIGRKRLQRTIPQRIADALYEVAIEELGSVGFVVLLAGRHNNAVLMYEVQHAFLDSKTRLETLKIRGVVYPVIGYMVDNEPLIVVDKDYKGVDGVIAVAGEVRADGVHLEAKNDEDIFVVSVS